jgi:hypothetical protein
VNMVRTADNLAALATMSKVQLRSRWAQVYRSPAPDVSPTLLALGIAHRVQVRRAADLPPASQRELRQLGEVLARDGTLTSEPLATIKPGTALVRSWHGVTHQVLITDRGYVYKGQTYRSLSHIAREITGAHWSGPRFFGIKRRTRSRPPSLAVGMTMSASGAAHG